MFFDYFHLKDGYPSILPEALLQEVVRSLAEQKNYPSSVSTVHPVFNELIRLAVIHICMCGIILPAPILKPSQNYCQQSDGSFFERAEEKNFVDG
jgi:hypothetical protein